MPKEEKGEPAFPRCESYEDLRAELGKLPLTWYPDLVRALVTHAYERGVFLEGGASRFISKVEDNIAKVKEKEKAQDEIPKKGAGDRGVQVDGGTGPG